MDRLPRWFVSLTVFTSNMNAIQEEILTSNSMRQTVPFSFGFGFGFDSDGLPDTTYLAGRGVLIVTNSSAAVG